MNRTAKRQRCLDIANVAFRDQTLRCADTETQSNDNERVTPRDYLAS